MYRIRGKLTIGETASRSGLPVPAGGIGKDDAGESVGPYSFGQRVPRFDRLLQQLHAHLAEQFVAFG